MKTKMLISHEFNDTEEAKSFLDHVEAFCHYRTGESCPTPTASEQEAPPEPPAEEKKTRRRGRPHGSKAKPKEETPPEAPPEPPVEEKPKGRRSRSKPAEKETAATPGDIPTSATEISDAELVKAASEAAEKLDVQPVMDALESFQVEVDGNKVVPEKVNELDQAQRVEFLAILRDLMNPITEKKKW